MKDGDLKDGSPAEEASEFEDTDEQLWEEFTGDAPSEEDDPAEDGKDDTPDPGADADDDPSRDTSEDDDGPDKADDAPKIDPKQLQEQMERLQHQLSSEQGRTAKQRREIERLQSQIAKAETTPSDQGSNTSDSREELEQRLNQAKEDYPDVIGPLADMIKSMESRFDELSTRDIQDLQAKRDTLDELAAEEEGRFLEEHPDGFDVVTENREVFNQWIEDQPKQLRDIFKANTDLIVDGTGAALLVSRFKQSLLDAGADPSPAHQEKSRLNARRQKQLDGARSARTGNRQAKTSDIPSEADDETLFDYWVQKDEEKERRNR